MSNDKYSSLRFQFAWIPHGFMLAPNYCKIITLFDIGHFSNGQHCLKMPHCWIGCFGSNANLTTDLCFYQYTMFKDWLLSLVNPQASVCSSAPSCIIKVIFSSSTNAVVQWDCLIGWSTTSCINLLFLFQEKKWQNLLKPLKSEDFLLQFVLNDCNFSISGFSTLIDMKRMDKII